MAVRPTLLTPDRAVPAPAESSSAKRGRNAPGEGSRLRGEIVAAAERLLAQAAPDEALSLRAVAREAGIAAPSIYLQFPSKEALLRGVVADCFAALRDAVRTAAAGIDDPRAALLTGCLAYCRFAADRPGAYRALFLTPRPGLPPESGGEDTGADAFGVLVGAIAACQTAGCAHPGEPRRLAQMVWIGLHGIAALRWALPDEGWPPLEDQVGAVLAGLVGVRPEPDPTAE